MKAPNDHQFKGNLFFLSNMYKAPIIMDTSLITPTKLEHFKNYFEFDGYQYPSSENLYQALKDRFIDGRNDFRFINPFDAKKRGRLIQGYSIRPNWPRDKIVAMELVVDLKFNIYPDLAEKLMNTPDEDIIEWNTWGDVFWGKCIKTQKGSDYLGQILRAKKQELIKQRKNYESRSNITI